MAIRIGSDEPTTFYVGENSATAIYLGETLVWSASTPEPPSTTSGTYGGAAYGSAGYGG